MIEPVFTEQMDKPIKPVKAVKPATRKIAYCEISYDRYKLCTVLIITVESTVVSTSVNQPTTLVVKLADNYKVEVTWKKDGQPVNHPVLPDGSLYIVNTSLSDNGEYSVTVTINKRTTVENLQLNVFDLKLLPG